MIKKITAAVLAALLLCALAACGIQYTHSSYVQVYETTGTKSALLTRRSDLEWQDSSLSGNATVTVDTSEEGQAYGGFGATMTHASAALLMQADETTRAAVLNDLFSDDGANFNYVRIPIGATDYIAEDAFFTCDDTENNEEDLSFDHFSISHDEDIIAVLKEALAVNPDITFIAVPWSAPAWMKTNKSLIGGSLDEQYNDAYAEYILRFVQAYAEEGIEIDLVCILNEPYIQGVAYPSMNMDGLQAADIISSLGAKLENAGLSAEIIAYDHNYSSGTSISAELYIDAVLGNEESAKYVTGIAFHGYENDGFDDFSGGLEYVTENYGKDVYITEITEYSASIDFASNISYSLQNVVINPLNYGLKAGTYWNFVLTSDGQPVLGNTAECYGVINLDLESDGWHYSKNASYYAMAHVSKFVYDIDGKDAVRLGTESSNTNIIATSFYRADGAVVVIVHNISDVSYEAVDVVIGDRQFTYEIQPQSVVTFVC